MIVTFPSLPFFEALRAAMRNDVERFRRLGFFDTTFAVRVLPDDGTAGTAAFTLVFQVFDLTDAREGIAGEVDFVLEGPERVWREMLDNIHALGGADTAHSINTLTHFGEHLRVCYDDPNGHDMLYRFAESIQQFFDLSARIAFAYPDGTEPPARAGTSGRMTA